MSDHVDRLVSRVAEAVAGPLETDADLAALQTVLEATALELDAPERPLAEALRHASNEIELVRFTVSRDESPTALESRLAPLRALVVTAPGV